MKIKKILVVMAIATLICTMAVATAFATTNVKNEKKDAGISIDSKEKKVSSYKIKWDYNGGKIGNKKTKVTTVKKGSKIAKLPATPKKSGFTFQGWYTKKNGGKKVSANTKPTKSGTLYAHWRTKSNSRGLTAEEKKLVGQWSGVVSQGVIRNYYFKNDGTFKSRVNKEDVYRPVYIKGFSYVWGGKWQISKNTLYLTNVKIATWSGSGLPPKNKPINWKNDKKQTLSLNFVKNHHEFRDGLDFDYGEGIKIDGVFYAIPGRGLYNSTHIPSWMFEGW